MSTPARLATMATLVTLGALLALILMLALPPGPPGFIGAAPLALAILAGLLGVPRWPLVTAILLLPYFSYGVMEVLTNPAGRTRAMAFSALTIIGFLASLDRFRRK